jgi:hypothetical protein
MKKHHWKALLFLVYAIILGVALIVLYVYLRNFFGLHLPPWPVSAVSLVTAVLVAIAAHELGHVLAGLWVRYDFFFVSAGIFKLEKTAAGLRGSVDWNSPNLFGGLTIMLPDEQNETRSNEAWLVAGGPLASIVLFAVLTSIALSLYAFGSGSYWVNAMVYFSWMTANVSLAFGLLNLYPEDYGHIKSDGYHLLSIWRGSNEFLVSRMINRLVAQSLRGLQPSILDTSLMFRILDKGSNQEQQVARLLLYEHFSDTGKFQKAEEYLNAAVEVAEQIDIPPINPSIFLEKAFWEVFFHGNAEKALHYFEKGKRGYSEKSTFSRAQTALLFSKGEIERARKAAQETRKQIRKSMDRGGAIWGESMLNRLLEKYFAV